MRGTDTNIKRTPMETGDLYDFTTKHMDITDWKK